MINFAVDQKLCNSCGLCAADCPAMIIAMKDGYPFIAPENDGACYQCQHCLAICPVGAVSILGVRPQESRLLAGQFPPPDQLETLIKGRRSVRRYEDKNLDPKLVQRLLEAASHAPTGKNSRQVRLTVIDDRDVMVKFRDEALAGLARLARDGKIPPGRESFAHFVRVWEEHRIDVIFRGAPHLLIASAPKSVPTPVVDGLIALSYFELFAQSLGVGTVWAGLVNWMMDDLLPDLRGRLGIPEDHVIGYAMLFGKPAVQYTRTVQHKHPHIERVSWK